MFNQLIIKKNIGMASYIAAALFTMIGFYKLLIYNGPDSVGSTVNTYVGGDAYNYIINANQAVAYFVLATLLVILGSAMYILINQEIIHNKITEKDGKESEVGRRRNYREELPEL